MDNKLDAKYEKRLREIDKRVEDLKEHMVMWGRAGGAGGKMAMQANSEIKELLEEKERILSGTQKRIDELEDIKNILELFKKRVKTRKRKEEYTSEIKEIKEQIKLAKGRSK